MRSAILAILLSFQPSSREQLPESPEGRESRLGVVAQAIESVANRAACHEQPDPCRTVVSDRHLAAAVLIVQARRESALRHDVQVGQCRPHECDRGRAKGTWQLHRAPTETVEQWRGYASTELEDVTSAAWRTITLWAGGAYRGRAQGLQLYCGFCRLAGYGVCWSDYGVDRAAEALRVAARLRAAP